MADLTKLIKISLDAGKTEVEINGIKHAIDDLVKSQKALEGTFISANFTRKNTEQAIQQEIIALQKQRAAIAETAIQYGQFTAKITEANMRLQVLKGNAVQVSGGMNQMRNNTGLASQTLVEVGRTISDANYGFTAVANNLSQLGYYFISLVGQSKGFGNAIKSLGSQLKGAGGLIIAFQLVIYLIEKYTLSQREAKRATKETADALLGAKGQIAQLEKYSKILNDSNSSLEAQKYALVQLRKEGYDKATGSVEEFLKAKTKLLLFDVKEEEIKKKIKNELEEQSKLEIELLELKTKANTRYTNILKKTSLTQTQKAGDMILAQKQFESKEDVLNKKIDDRQRKINSLLSQSVDAVKTLGIETKDNKFFESLIGDKVDKNISNNKLKAFKESLFDLSKESEKFRQESLEQENNTQQEILEQDRKFAIAELEVKKKSFIDKENLRKDNYIKELDEKKKQSEEDNKWTQEDEENYNRLKLEADETLKNELLEAEAEFLDAKFMLNAAYNNQADLLERKQFSKELDVYKSALMARRDFDRSGQIALETNEVEKLKLREKFRQEDFNETKIAIEGEIQQRKDRGEMVFGLEQQLSNLEIENVRKTEESKLAIRKAAADKAADDIDKAKEYVETLGGLLDANFQAQIDKEQNKTTAINNELKLRLNDENLSKDEKEKINKQIAANEEKLRVKQEKIEEKKFKTDKAFRIALALMDTASSALKAFSSQIVIADPTSIGRAFVAAGAATALGLAQVAMIAKQQFKSSQVSAPNVGSTSTSSSGGQTTEVQPPSFNIVGRSNVNQLAETIAGQSKTPIKTYVVAKDVSTAQELDRNIIESAAL